MDLISVRFTVPKRGFLAWRGTLSDAGEDLGRILVSLHQPAAPESFVKKLRHQ